jgi:hypothetical protein
VNLVGGEKPTDPQSAVRKNKIMAKRAKQIASVWEQGRLAGVAWIQTDGATDCSAAETRDQALDRAPSYETRNEFIAGFLAGVESMCVR